MAPKTKIVWVQTQSLAVSLATAKAAAKAKDMPFYRYVAAIAGTTNEMCLPMPMINIMNGGGTCRLVY